MKRWLRRTLARVQTLAALGRVTLTEKAARELELLELGLDHSDVSLILLDLQPEDFAGRSASRHGGEWMYVFNPRVAGERLYVKLILRQSCVVVSFQGEEDDDASEEG